MRAIRIPTKTVTVNDWARLCDMIERDGHVYLKCSREETRPLYLWARVNRGYNIGYKSQGGGILRVFVRGK
jgi:hypothetical protein